MKSPKTQKTLRKRERIDTYMLCDTLLAMCYLCFRDKEKTILLVRILQNTE